MRVYFLDVGQGTCNVIPIGKRRAIVIDTGREFSTLKRLLHRLSIHTVSFLVISHCDQDHCGGASALLSDTTIRTEKICFHIGHKTKKTAFWNKLEEMIQADEIDLEERLILLGPDEKPRQLWKAEDSSVEIKILAPTFGQVIRDHMSGDANAASGVLVLQTEEKAIVFPGDSHYRQWEVIHNNLGRRPLECDIIAVPHHAGITWDEKWDDSEVTAGLETLYNRFVKPKYAVVSVGTSNPYDHPRDAVILALRKAGATILCTQMTARCNPNLEVRRSSPVRPLLGDVPGASLPVLDQTDSNESRNVACAGTVVADVSARRITIHRLQEHQDGVDLLKRPLPLCRK
jgi:competence protein ComEC